MLPGARKAVVVGAEGEEEVGVVLRASASGRGPSGRMKAP